MTQDPKELFEQLCAYVEQTAERKHVPGVAVGVLYEDQTYTAGCGVTNVDHPLPVTAETLFQIGSISKTFTCLAVMRLVEANKLDLHAPLRTYIPDFQVADEDASAQATLWHLLTHMGGWEGDVFEDTGAGDDAMAKYVSVMADVEQLAPIGTVWSYNNAGFNLAGRVIELVTGKRFEEAMHELVFDPLGLDRCFYDPGDLITYRFAVGHGGEGAAVSVLRPWPLPRAAYPAGGITCDVGQLLRYARFQMGDGTAGSAGEEAPVHVLQPETMAHMHAPQASRWGETEQIALSWFADDVSGVRQLSHGGGTTGQISLLILLPARRFALAVLTNANAGGDVTGDVRRWALKHYLGLEESEPKPIEASEEELAQYAGLYTRPFAEVELGMLNGQLVAQMIYKRGFPSQDQPPPPPPPPAALGLWDKDRLLVVRGAGKGGRAEAIRTADGAIGWLRFGRIYRRVGD